MLEGLALHSVGARPWVEICRKRIMPRVVDAVTTPAGAIGVSHVCLASGVAGQTLLTC
jgi:hypothetical protein